MRGDCVISGVRPHAFLKFPMNQPYELNQFKILAHGKEFEVDQFLSSSSLSPTHVWHKGHTTSERPEPITSGFDIILGDGNSLDFDVQQQIAAQYVQSNLRALKACAEFPGVENFMIIIHQRKQIRFGTTGFWSCLSKHLLYLTNRVKMDAVTYVGLQWLDSTDNEWRFNRDAETT